MPVGFQEQMANNLFADQVIDLDGGHLWMINGACSYLLF